MERVDAIPDDERTAGAAATVSPPSGPLLVLGASDSTAGKEPCDIVGDSLCHAKLRVSPSAAAGEGKVGKEGGPGEGEATKGEGEVEAAEGDGASGKGKGGTGKGKGGAGRGKVGAGKGKGKGATAVPPRENRARTRRCRSASQTDQGRLVSAGKGSDENLAGVSGGGGGCGGGGGGGGSSGGGESCDNGGGGGTEAVPLEGPTPKIGDGGEVQLLGSCPSRMGPKLEAEPVPEPVPVPEVETVKVEGGRGRREQVGDSIPTNAATTTAPAKTRNTANMTTRTTTPVGIRTSRRSRQDCGLIPEAVIAKVIWGWDGGRRGGGWGVGGRDG